MTAGWADATATSAGIEAGYLERVSADIQLILGAGIEIDAVEIVDLEGGAGLRARYHLGERSFETAAPGESLIDAHRTLRARLVVDRLRLTFSETVEPLPGRKAAPRPAGQDRPSGRMAT